jgi:hypothetical protein
MTGSALPRVGAAGALLCFSLLACSSAGSPSSGTTGATRVVPAQEPAGVPEGDASADAGPAVCVERVLCVRTAHFDSHLCRCVSNADDAADAGADADGDADADGCNEHALCFAGYHWDPAPCRCVLDDSDGGAWPPVE